MAKQAQQNQAQTNPPTDEARGTTAKTIDDRRPEMASQLSMLDMIRNSPVQQKAWESRASMQSATRSVLQKAGEPSTPESPAPENTDKTETSPETATGEDTRTKEQKQEAVDAAKTEVEDIIGKAEGMADVQAHFTELKLKYGLNEIYFDGIGTSGASVIIEINPKAVAMASGLGANITKLSDGRPHGAKLAQDVKFTTASSRGGFKWAVKMEAKALGPEHPQGYGPRGLKKQMLPLPTNRAVHPGDKKHFIKGHLLNDNLGGPGSDENMFPITEDANKKHSSLAETTIKSWVNDDGYYVYYKVEVKNIDEQIDYALFDDGTNYVNAQLHITAYKLGADGERANVGSNVHLTINSEFNGTSVDTSDLESLPDKGGSAPARRTGFVPELSANKSDEVDYHDIPKWYESELDDAVKLGIEAGLHHSSAGMNVSDQVRNAIGASQDGMTLIRRSILEDKSISTLTSGSDKRIVWNGSITKIIQNEAKVREKLSEFKKVAHTMLKVGDPARDLMGGLYSHRPGTTAEFVFFYKNVATIDEMVEASLYKGGYLYADEDRRFEDADLKLNPTFKRGYDEYVAAIEAKKANVTLNTTHAHKKATQEYELGLAEAVAGNRRPVSGAGKAGFNQYNEALRSLLERGESLTTSAAIKANADFKAGYLEAQSKGSAPDHEGGRKGYRDYNDEIARIRNNQSAGKSPAAKAAREDYNTAVETLNRGVPDSNIKGQEAALMDYDDAIDKKLAGQTRNAGPATALANDAYTYIIGRMTEGSAYNKRNRIGSRLSGLYDTALAAYEGNNAAGDNPIALIVKNLYDDGVDQLQRGVYERNDGKARLRAIDDYFAGYQDFQKDQNNKTTRAYQVSRNDYVRGYNDGYNRQSKNEDGYAYIMGHKDGDENSPYASHSKRRKVDPHALD